MNKTGQSLLDMKEVIDEVANSLKAFSEGKTDTPLRYVLPFNEGNRYLVMRHYLMILKWLVLKQLHLRQIILKRQKDNYRISVIK